VLKTLDCLSMLAQFSDKVISEAVASFGKGFPRGEVYLEGPGDMCLLGHLGLGDATEPTGMSVAVEDAAGLAGLTASERG
jgi:hypothetical protein